MRTLGLALALLGCSTHGTSTEHHATTTPPPFRPQLGPRTDLGRFHPHRAVALDDGSVLLGATLHDPAYDDHPVWEPLDKQAAGFTVLGVDGVARRPFQIAGAHFVELARIGSRIIAVIERISAVDVEAKQATYGVAMVDLDVAGAKAGAETPLLTTTAAASVDVTGIDGDVAIVMSEYDGHDTKSTVMRVGPDGHERWRRVFTADLRGAHDVGGGKLAIFERSEAKLATRVLDARGADVTSYELARIGEELGGHGDFEAVVRDGAELMLVGEVGGNVSLGGTTIERPPHSAQPFVLVTSETHAPQFFDLNRGNGFVRAAGRWMGRTAIAVSINAAPDDAPTLPRGLYLLGWDREPAHRVLFPIYQYRYEDDNENTPTITVAGAPIDVDAIAWTEHVAFVAGTCKIADATFHGCVQQITDGAATPGK